MNENKRLSLIIGDQLGVVTLNRTGWKYRVPFSIRRKVADASLGCAICGQQDSKALALDHCHDTGVTRGFLCMACNTALGKFNDDPALLRKAIAYLEDSIPYVDM